MTVLLKSLFMFEIQYQNNIYYYMMQRVLGKNPTGKNPTGKNPTGKNPNSKNPPR